MNDIEKVRKDGAEEKDLNKVKETLIQNRIKSLKRNNWWMNILYNTYQEDYNSFKYCELDTYQEAIESIQTTDLQQAVKQYFNDQNRIEIVMKPAPAESN